MLDMVAFAFQSGSMLERRSMDPSLVVRAQAGDQAAFEALARATGDRLVGLAYGILRDRDRAEEATQRTLVAAWEELPRLRDPARFEPWIRQMLANACYGELRRDRRRLLPGVREIPLGPQPDPSDAVAERDAIDRAFRRLPPDLRVVLAYRYFVDLPVDRIAHELGIPEGTVKSRLHRATAEIRAALEAETRLPAEPERQR
jgi:RNA polymerase sigma-70 factor, ECF subfamily